MNYLIFAGIAAGLLISVPLGPVGVLIIRKTLNKGRFAGYFGGAGATTADTFFAIIAGFGVSIITDFIDTYQFEIRIVGGLILSILAYRIFFSNVVDQVRQKSKRSTLWADLMHTYFLTLSNPLTIIVIGAIFAAGGPGKNAGHIEILTLILGVFIGAASWWLILVTVINIFRKNIRLKSLWYLNKITGLLIFVFGLFVLLSAFDFSKNFIPFLS
ncbi:MAG: LysE family transporter [Bacteroidales bacterium]|nr:LysE family transporter [Bacteroidales bacterium]